MAIKFYQALKVFSMRLRADDPKLHSNELIQDGKYHIDEDLAWAEVGAGNLQEIPEEV